MFLTNDKSCSNLSNNSFNEWLVGVTDGDGTFHFRKTQKGYWSFSFQIGQNVYNLRMLNYIKSKIGIGSISVSKNIAVYRVRNAQDIVNYILPIFENNMLLTSKYYYYSIFKKAIYIMIDKNISNSDKDIIISNLKEKYNSGIPSDYISPCWKKIKYDVSDINKVNLIMSKNWLIGFTEAEGSFYIVKKGHNRYAHGFEITQKLDIIVLQAISTILYGKVVTKSTYNTMIVIGNKNIPSVINYYNSTMKGMKSVEYRIWARSFNKMNKDSYYLASVQEKIRKIKNIYKKLFVRNERIVQHKNVTHHYQVY